MAHVERVAVTRGWRFVTGFAQFVPCRVTGPPRVARLRAMARPALATLVCVALLPAAAAAADRQNLDVVIGQYDRGDIAAGAIQVSASAEVVYVSGTSDRGPWLDIWRRSGGEWKLVAEMVVSEIAPIRFGVKRSRSCRTS